jgi:hypothetical protein
MSDTPDLTPEAVNRAIGMCRVHGLHGTEAMLRALSAALATERARAEAAGAEVAQLRDMLDDALKFWIALDPEAEASAEVLSMRAALQEPHT